MKAHAKIKCPSCSELTDVEGENFVCDVCQKPLSGYIYKKDKPIYTTFTSSAFTISLLISGTYIGIDKFLHHKYPAGFEYYIVSACVNLHKTPLNLVSYKKKQEICICAYNKVIKKIHYDEFEKPESKDAYSEFITECGKESQNQSAL